MGKFRKVFNKTAIITLSSMLIFTSTVPLTGLDVKADRVTGEITHKAESQSDAHAEASASGGGGEGGGASAHAEADATSDALAIIKNGRYVELSAYLLESVQGLNRSTYVPKFEDAIDNDFMYEYEHSGIRENRYFSDKNKRQYLFKQDGKFNIEYVEALNWLYNNNLVHKFEDIEIKYTAPAVTGNKKGSEIISINDSGSKNGDKKSIEIPKGSYTLEYDNFTIPDSIYVEGEGGGIIGSSGLKNGKGQFAFTVSKDQIIKIGVNEGTGEEKVSTAWEYSVVTQSGSEYDAPGKSTVTLTEQEEKDSYIYPIDNNSGIALPIKRKDFLMQLMKVVDGVEESRPLLIESQFEYVNMTGQQEIKTSLFNVLKSKYKDQIGDLGMDSAINQIEIDFNKYGMHKYYVNPNVYELYLYKAFNSGVISKNEVSDPSFLAQLDLLEGHKGKDVSQGSGIGKALPRWFNTLPPVRINTKAPVNNNGEYNTVIKTRVFGNSYNDPSSNTSNLKLKGGYKYNKDHEYFKKENISYTDAVIYAYKAINAYSDEKLPQREVDTIMSMYSVNYGRLSEKEKEALNYLIAKGIIDGDNAAKYTSTENITVEDAMILNYRIANPSARLTFKTIFEVVDQSMLERGFGQSKTSLKSYSDELPEMDIQSTEKDDYYIIMNDTLKDNNFQLGETKFNKLELEGLEESTTKYSSEDLSKLGLLIEKGDYTVRKYSIPWNAQLNKLGMTLPKSDKDLPQWINLELGGGFYYINESLLTGKTEELKFQRIYSNIDSLNQEIINVDDLFESGVWGVESIQEEDKGKGKDSKTKEEIEEDLKKQIKETNDDNDPLDLLSFNNKSSLTEKVTVKMDKYMADEKEHLKVYLGVNEKAKNHLMLDGKPLFINGELNKDHIQKIKDINSIVEVDGKPTDGNGKEISEQDLKVFLEFTFPKTGQRSVSELKSLLKRRMTLSGEAEVKDEDIASYTGLSNGQTMISMKELKRFGISTSKEEPDILYHEQTNTYAYLNNEKDYALISNTVINFPEDSLMIEITADEIYYNIHAVMSLLNDRNFYVFNSDGKYEVVNRLDGLASRDIYNPDTNQILDRTYTADIKKFDAKDKTKEVEAGKYINISAISGEPATFFMSFSKQQGMKKNIYGFEPYYVKTTPLANNNSVNPNKVVEELSLETSDIIHIENLLLNNSILRKEFSIPKSETFIYTDNAIKVTNLTSSESYEFYAESYLDFITQTYKGMSEKDIKGNAETMKESNPYSRNKDFSMNDLLERNLYVDKDNIKVKKLIGDVKKGKDVEAFWVLYFLDKFTVTLPPKAGKDSEDLQNEFNAKLLSTFNKKYKFSNGVKLEKADDLGLLRTTTASETDIREKRLYNIKRIIPAPNNGFITTDDALYLNRNDAVYMKVPFFAQDGVGGQQEVAYLIEPLGTDKYNVIFDKYMAGKTNNKISTKQDSTLDFQRQMLGTTFYTKGVNLYSPRVEQFKSLPRNEKPLEIFPNGTKFTMSTGYGEKDEFVVVNNMVTKGAKNSHSESVTVKIARVNTKPLGNYVTKGNNSKEKLFNYYSDVKNYGKSITTLGKFSTAVHAKREGLEHTIRADEINRSLYNYNPKNIIYFDYKSKAGNSVYIYATDLVNGKNKTDYMVAYPRDINSYSISSKVGSDHTKLIFGNTEKNKLNSLSDGNSNKSKVKYLYKDGTTVKENYMVYDSFLIDYGTISLNSENVASLNKRTDYLLNSSPVLTDLVDELVKAVKLDRLDTKPKTVGDLVNSDKLALLEGTQGENNEFTLIKTSTGPKNGYSHFITSRTMENSITPSELEYSNSLILKNYGVLDQIKISVNKERRSIYYFIGNEQLSLASSSDINRYKKELDFPTSSTSNTLLIEQSTNKSKIIPKEFKIDLGTGNKAIPDGKVSDVPNANLNKGYPYFLSIYLDSNLLVKKNDKGFYEIIGYAEDNLINTKAFTSRADRFEGVFDSLMTVLPTYSNIDGKFLGFDLSKLEIDSFKKLFTFDYWNNLITNAVYNIEQVLSALGIYYIYLLMVLVILGRAMPGIVYKWLFNPVKLLSFGKLDIDNMNMTKFMTQCIFMIALLSLVYGGFIRVLILKAEEVRQLVAEYFFYPFL